MWNKKGRTRNHSYKEEMEIKCLTNLDSQENPYTKSKSREWTTLDSKIFHLKDV